jgi:hypothetical protein
MIAAREFLRGVAGGILGALSYVLADWFLR